MKELEMLLNQRWILKAEDKELYYRVRDSVGELRKYCTEKLGCQILDNSLMITLWESGNLLHGRSMCTCAFY